MKIEQVTPHWVIPVFIMLCAITLLALLVAGLSLCKQCKKVEERKPLKVENGGEVTMTTE